MDKIVSAEKRFAMMTANGFNEAEFITLQKAIMAKHAQSKIISSNVGLVHSDPKTGNGISYAVDYALSETLAVDYDSLIVIGGDKHIEMLSDEPHAIRLVRAFLRESMPILFVGKGSILLDIIGDKRFSGLPNNDEKLVKLESAYWSVDGLCLPNVFNEFYEMVHARKSVKAEKNGVAA